MCIKLSFDFIKLKSVVESKGGADEETLELGHRSVWNCSGPRRITPWEPGFPGHCPCVRWGDDVAGEAT